MRSPSLRSDERGVCYPASPASRTARARRRTRCRGRRGRGVSATPSPACACASASVFATKTRAVVGEPSRDPVPPPQLPRHAPRLDVLHPVEEGLLPRLRHDPDRARLAPPRSPAWPASRRRHTIGRSATARSPRPSGRRRASGSRGPRRARAQPAAVEHRRPPRLRASKRSRPSSSSGISPSAVCDDPRLAHRAC